MLSNPLAITLSEPTEQSYVPRPRRFLLQPCPSSPDDYFLSLSNNSLEPFTICQRKAENRLVKAREGIRSDSPKDFGALFHSCEEIRLRRGLDAETISQQKKLIHDHFLSHPVPPEDHRTASRMLEVVDKYNSLYANDGWPGKVVKDAEGEPVIERRFEIPLCSIEVNAEIAYQRRFLAAGYNPTDDISCENLPIRTLHILWTGILDVLLSESSFLWVVDHKTTSMGGREFEDSFHLASQTVGYAWAAQKITGQKPTGCLINQILIRPPVKTKSSIPREEFNRLNYFYDQDRIDEWEESTKNIVADLVSSLVRGYFPMSGPKSFKSPCVYCEYADNCRLPSSQRAADLASGLYRDVTTRAEVE